MEHTNKDKDVSKESVAFPFLRPVNLTNIQRAGQYRTRTEHPDDKMRERSSPRGNQQGTGADSARGRSSFMGRVELFQSLFLWCLILTKHSSPQDGGPIR